MRHRFFFHVHADDAQFVLMLKELLPRINKCLGLASTMLWASISGVLNEGGRAQDEFVKHKLFDVIGDPYPLGRPILGEFVGCARPPRAEQQAGAGGVRCTMLGYGRNVLVSRRTKPILHPEASSAV